MCLIKIIDWLSHRKKFASFFHVSIDDGKCQNAVLLCPEFQNTILVERTVDHDRFVNINELPTRI